MTLLVKTVPINTNASGDATATVRAGGCRLHAIDLSIGDLDTPDVTITEEPIGTQLLALTGASGDGRYQPLVVGSDDAGAALDTAGDVAYAPPAILGRIQIVVAGGGNKKSGEITLLLER